MTRIDWQLSTGSGGRSIEVPFIQRKVASVRDSVIADYGCLGRPGIFTTDSYNIHPSNTVIGVDCRSDPLLASRYIQADICAAPIAEGSVDVGLCVSVIEHIGTGAYGDDKPVAGRDLMALTKMAKDLRKTGQLYVTFPVGPTAYVIDGWIRVYTPESVTTWASLLPELDLSLELFKLINGSWFACTATELSDVRHYTPGTDINAIGALTVCWKP